MSLAEASERKALKALRQSFETGSLFPPFPSYDGRMDSYIIGVIELLASRQITLDQARQIFGNNLSQAVWDRFGDLADAYLEPCGQNPRVIWEEYKNISEVIAANHIPKPIPTA